MVTDNSVYHWSLAGGQDDAPVKMFDRHDALRGSQVLPPLRGHDTVRPCTYVCAPTLLPSTSFF